MLSMKEKDLDLLYKYASECNFIIETGGGGSSTKYLSKAAIENDAKMITIEFREEACKSIEGTEHMIGWSVKYDDIVKKGEPNFIDMKKEGAWKRYLDGRVAHGDKSAMEGEVDLIRKALVKYSDKKLDFFFCDTGEYYGLAEWNIVKKEIKIKGYFVIHDIYYPKSIKGFKIVKRIRNSKEWQIVEQTETKQGLLIAKKIR